MTDKKRILDRVLHRFSTYEKAVDWFETGSVPGFGDETPKSLVAKGKADELISAIDAIESGVYA